MKATTVLKTLINKLKENGIIRYDKEFLSYIGISSDIVTPKQLNDFLRRDGEIRNKFFLKQIEEFFGLSPELWSGSEYQQQNLIQEALNYALKLKNLPDESYLDITNFIPNSTPATKEQIKALNEFKQLKTRYEQESKIEEFKDRNFLTIDIKNQEFLVGLIQECYKSGLYAIIVSLLIPNLVRKYRFLVNIQKIEAHSLGSLGEYKEAKLILSTLEHYSTIENINLRTSALSNLKREVLNQENFTKESLIHLIKGYKELHSIKGIYSYYTGINLLYLIMIGQTRFSDDDYFNSFDTKAIYEYSKPSLRNDNTHESYYNMMSEFEFLLLLDRSGVIEKIESFLENDKPAPSLIERTLRQMKLFVRCSNNKNHSIVKRYLQVIQILEDYLKIFDTIS